MFQNYLEAKGSCADGEYRFASYTALVDSNLTSAMPGLSSKAVATDYPYYDFCTGNCQTYKTEIAADSTFSPIAPYTV